MEPITFITLMWFSWGLTRMFLRGDDDEPTAADWNTARPSAKGGRGGGEKPAAEPGPEIRERVRQTVRDWIRQADENADAAREIRWNDADWWRQALVGAFWTPVRDMRDGAKWVKQMREERKARREQAAADEATGEASDPPPGDSPPNEGDGAGTVHDDDTTDAPPRGERAGWFRWGRPRREDPPPPPPPAPEPDEFTVEFVGSRPNTPPPAELTPPARALTAGNDDSPAPDDPPTLAEPIPEGTPTLSGQLVAPSNGSVVIPGQTAVARTTGGDGLTHDEAMQMATAIVRLIGDCPDPVGRVLRLIETSARGVATKIDNLQAAGVTGSVLGRWCDVMVHFSVAHHTAKLLQAQIDQAFQMAADARRHQAAVGNPIQETVTAAGSNAAHRTDYYRKQ